MFILASSVCKSLQYLTSTLTQGGKGGYLFRLTCTIVLRGGRNTAYRYHWRVWGVLTVSGSHWVCCHSRRVCFPGPHCLGFRLFCWELSEAALGCVHFPGLCRSGSGSRVPHRGTGSVGPAFCALPRSEQLRRSGAWPAHTPQVRRILSSPRPSPLASWVHSGVSGVPCVSSGELISGCDLSDGCQPSRIPGRLG